MKMSIVLRLVVSATIFSSVLSVPSSSSMPDGSNPISSVFIDTPMSENPISDPSFIGILSSPSSPEVHGIDCLINEHYEECGTSCEPTCETTDTDICNLMCNQGCFCDEGYVRGQFGDCIEQSHCGECSTNQTYSGCTTPCVATCQNRGAAFICFGCDSGCFCKPDYILNEDTNECIKEVDCPERICSQNEHAALCSADACEMVCLGDHKETMCYENGCFSTCLCDDGFFRNLNWECVC